MFADVFDYNSIITLRTYTTAGQQSTKTWTTVYNGKCFASISSKSNSFNEDGIRVNERWQIMINPKDWLVSTAGTLVTGKTQTLKSGAWVASGAYKIENQNWDGSIITVSSVVGSVDGALSTDDYSIAYINGSYYIVFRALVDCTNLTTITQDIVITYNYTPATIAPLPFTYDWKNADAIFKSKTYTVEYADDFGEYGELFVFNIYKVF